MSPMSRAAGRTAPKECVPPSIENGELIKIEGPSYRIKKRKQQAQGLEGLQ
jgi:hypothetical protein